MLNRSSRKQKVSDEEAQAHGKLTFEMGACAIAHINDFVNVGIFSFDELNNHFLCTVNEFRIMS